MSSSATGAESIGDTASTHDRRFLPLVEQLADRTITLADRGFAGKGRAAEPQDLLPRGVERAHAVETVLSLVHRVCGPTYRWRRVRPYLDMHLAYVAALFNALLALDDTHRAHPALARFAL